MQHGNHSVVILHTERVPLSSSSTERGHVQCVTHPSSVSAAAVAAARLGARSHGCWCCITKGPLIPGTETRPKARPRPAVQPPPRNRWTRRTNQAGRSRVPHRRGSSLCKLAACLQGRCAANCRSEAATGGQTLLELPRLFVTHHRNLVRHLHATSNQTKRHHHAPEQSALAASLVASSSLPDALPMSFVCLAPLHLQ